MKVTVKINTDTPAGKRLEEELRRYPECVEFIESTVVSEPTPIAYVSVKEVSGQVREHVKSISASESAKLAFQRLGEKYNRTFDNKYTR
ncbi:MAG: hypothetical protein WCJ61_03370 [Paludibacter sp.]